MFASNPCTGFFLPSPQPGGEGKGRRSACTAPALRLPWACSGLAALHEPCACSALALHMPWAYSALAALHEPCACSAPALHIPWACCSARAMRLLCVSSAHALREPRACPRPHRFAPPFAGLRLLWHSEAQYATEPAPCPGGIRIQPFASGFRTGRRTALRPLATPGRCDAFSPVSRGSGAAPPSSSPVRPDRRSRRIGNAVMTTRSAGGLISAL